ncbi:MAG: DUF166 family (seleno)protein DfsP [Thermodesulfobacteriota bacterium]
MPTRIIVFQQAGSGDKKIAGLKEYGHDLEIVASHDLPLALPDFIDEPEEFFPEQLSGDLILNFLRHPDLADYLVSLAQEQQIPIVTSGPRQIGAISPFTCCGLAKRDDLGSYGRQFGAPEFRISCDEEGKIGQIVVTHGASCGATWQVIDKLKGLTPEAALECAAREVQFLCQADPSSFDPVSGKSPVHFAGHLHHQALVKALRAAGK